MTTVDPSVRPAPRPVERDPLGAILGLDRRHNRVGLAVGLCGALFVHGAAAGTGLQQLWDLEAFAGSITADIEEELRGVYDVAIDEPPPPPPEPEVAPPTPEPDENAPAEQAPEDAPAAEPPPAAAAGEALTAEADPDAPLDLTGGAWSMVTGPGTRYSGGASQRGGTSDKPVYDRRAKADGDPNANRPRAAVATPRKEKRDLSRPAALASGGSWNSCGFPAEAEMGQIDYARVELAVTVGTDGKPQRVAVLGENPSGYGFGSLATSCAYRKSFRAALDADGNPMVATIPRLGVTFTR